MGLTNKSRRQDWIRDQLDTEELAISDFPSCCGFRVIHDFPDMKATLDFLQENHG